MSANIQKTKRPVEGDASKYWGPGKNKMAYFFGVLENLLQHGRQAPEPPHS